MKITCYECGKIFDDDAGVYSERRVTNPEVIPAVTESTGYGYCSEQCAERHHQLEKNNEVQDFGNYEETDDSILINSPDGSVRGEVLRMQELRKSKKERHAA